LQGLFFFAAFASTLMRRNKLMDHTNEIKLINADTRSVAVFLMFVLGYLTQSSIIGYAGVALMWLSIVLLFCEWIQLGNEPY
jgi:ribonucleotide reductase beta subunit family protein with ferritin-like domain